MKIEIEQSLSTIQSPKVRAIAAKSAVSYVNLLAHKESELLEVMQEVEEGKTINVSHALILDLGKNTQKDRVSFSAKHQIECDGEIPDPNQPELPNVNGEGDE